MARLVLTLTLFLCLTILIGCNISDIIAPTPRAAQLIGTLAVPRHDDAGWHLVTFLQTDEIIHVEHQFMDTVPTPSRTVYVVTEKPLNPNLHEYSPGTLTGDCSPHFDSKPFSQVQSDLAVEFIPAPEPDWSWRYHVNLPATVRGEHYMLSIVPWYDCTDVEGTCSIGGIAICVTSEESE